MNHRNVLLAAGLLGAIGVGLGAFGAHALKPLLLERGTANAWETAVRYQLWHALGLLVLGVWSRQASSGSASLLRWAAGAWIAGIIVFSGSLYWLSLSGPRWLGPITPLGGLGLMAGWLLIGLAGLKKEPVA